MSKLGLQLIDELFTLLNNESIYEYTIAKYEDVAQMVKVMVDAFYFGPVKDPCVSLLPSRIYADWCYVWIISTWHKKSYFCAKHKYSRELVGACCAEDEEETSMEPYESFLYDVQQEKGFVGSLNELCAELKKDFVEEQIKIGSAWYIENLCVDPAHRNKGIAKRLIQESVSLAKTLKPYRIVFAECSNSISFRCFQKCGFTCFRELKYKDWEHPKKSGNFPLQKYNSISMYDTLRLIIVVCLRFTSHSKTFFFFLVVKKFFLNLYIVFPYLIVGTEPNYFWQLKKGTRYLFFFSINSYTFLFCCCMNNQSNQIQTCCTFSMLARIVIVWISLFDCY
ncbi:hypothetical protein RFI_24837 [Reticulomyxa filosa]|uniref:N-acetyltransferase domain-containing protein n=1 Tax=Reticulomyxa filosa TaxID=46433 RepID=X6MHJ1_RETFI|nr:hypothetical protein RFI_24837 [Reticulomyxa filosa]|eukprot:ETO12535.1 hypothetical protein RFI_24837 [Reticulomyxa filosa]